MARSLKYSDLQGMSEQDLIEAYDMEAKTTRMGAQFYLDELAH